MPKPMRKLQRSTMTVTVPVPALVDRVRRLNQIPDDAELMELTWPEGWGDDGHISLVFVNSLEDTEEDFD